MGKYLFHLNSHEVEEKRLLETTPVASYLDTLTDVEIGSSSILHRMKGIHNDSVCIAFAEHLKSRNLVCLVI